MRGLRKLINWLDWLDDMIADRGKALQVADQSGRITANIDNLSWRHLAGSIDQGFIKTFTWWVNDQDIGLQAFFLPFRHLFFGLTHYKFGIIDLIDLGILLGIFNRGWNDFNPVDLFGMLGHRQRNRTNATIGVNHSLRTIQSSCFNCRLIKLFGLLRINLLIRQRRNRGAISQELVMNRIAAPKRMILQS